MGGIGSLIGKKVAKKVVKKVVPKGKIKQNKDKIIKQKQTIKQVKEKDLARKEKMYQRQRILDVIKSKQNRLKTIVVPELKKAYKEDIKYLKDLLKKGKTF